MIIYRKCPNCGNLAVEQTDSNPGEKFGTITEVCVKCKRKTIVNKQLVI